MEEIDNEELRYEDYVAYFGAQTSANNLYSYIVDSNITTIGNNLISNNWANTTINTIPLTAWTPNTLLNSTGISSFSFTYPKNNKKEDSKIFFVNKNKSFKQIIKDKMEIKNMPTNYTPNNNAIWYNPNYTPNSNAIWYTFGGPTTI